MEKILVAYGIPEKLVAAIMKLYEGTKAKVVSPDGDTALVLDHAMRRATEGTELDLGFIVQKRRSNRDLPLVSSKVRQRRLRLSGHCIRHQEEIA